MASIHSPPNWHLVLAWWLLLTAVATRSAAEPGGGEDANNDSGNSKCRSLCTACESLQPARINQICSVGLLTGCSCPEFALNLTLAVRVSAGDFSTRDQIRNCPATAAAAKIGYCPFGQRTDSTGCPLGVCLPAPGCQQQQQPTPWRDSNPRPPAVPPAKSPLANCAIYCPFGYQTDPSDGCPTCRCRCSSSVGDVADSAELVERRCAADCAVAGAAGYEMRPPATGSNGDGGCPVCLCLTPALASPAPAPAPPPPPPQPSPTCLLRCPNSCGPHGYAVADAAERSSRDERGCVRDCSCRCPARKDCQAEERCLNWETDSYGCRICSTCSGGNAAGGGSGSSSSSSSRISAMDCVTKSMLDRTPAGQQSRLIGGLCGHVTCPAGSAYLVAPGDNFGCLTCSCQAVAMDTATTHQAPVSCPLLSLEVCLINCPDGNATLFKDSANGCYACGCAAQQQQNQRLSTLCPLAFAFLQRCPRSCGPYGYDTDPITGCQRSCRCNCPNVNNSNNNNRRLPIGSDCSCFFGRRRDQYGCETCDCITEAEYMQFLPLV